MCQQLHILIESIQVTLLLTSCSWVLSSLTWVKFMLWQITQSKKLCSNCFKDHRSEKWFMKYPNHTKLNMYMCACVYVFLCIEGLLKVISALELIERTGTSIGLKIQTSPSSFFCLDPNRPPEVQRENSISAPSPETCTAKWDKGLGCLRNEKPG